MKPILAIASVFLLAAASVSCGGADSGVQDASALLERAEEAMTSASFSYTDTECPLCQPTPTVTEYAPPDRIKLSHPKGHDDWPFYLIAGDQWFVSQDGDRWLTESADYKHPFILLFDPRLLLALPVDPVVEKDEVIDGMRNHVVRAEVDADHFLSELGPAEEQLSEAEGEQAREFYRGYADGLAIRFWIDEQSFLVTQIEIDVAPLPSGDQEDQMEDPEPAVIRFDFDAPVDVPGDPESIQYEEAQRLRREAESRTRPLVQAIVEYKKVHGVYPPRLDPETLKDFLPTPQWPINPFTGEPVRQAEDSPGDFDYKVKNSGRDYELSLFGWDSRYSYADTARFGHTEEYSE